MSFQAHKQGANKPKTSSKDIKKADQDPNDVLMKEILAMGGSKEDMDLLQGIDSDSEVVELDQEETSPTIKKQDKKKSAKASKTAAVEEPELKNEVANFMKSLFGSALMDHKKVAQKVEDEDEGDENVDMADNGSGDDNDGQSEESWETEEEVNDDENEAEEAADDSDGDSGDDSMDDLPQELKEINAQLENRKRGIASTSKSVASSTPAKKVKTEASSPSAPSAPVSAKKTPTTRPVTTVSSATDKKSKNKNTLADVQKEVSVMLGKKPEVKAATKDKFATSTASKAKPFAAAAASKPKSKSASASSTTKSTASSNNKTTWKLGDGWSAAFEDDDLDMDALATSNKKNTQKKNQSIQRPNKGRGGSFKARK
ncbi:hypothetical protein EDD11_002807 [Mortierella claussenii]|nr:hypothetical protein EDD11_002807 [Mortierella claussenii]